MIQAEIVAAGGFKALVSQDFLDVPDRTAVGTAVESPRNGVASAAWTFLLMPASLPKPHHRYQLKTLLPFFGDSEVSRLNRKMTRAWW